jgi:hypothetical protein
LLRYYLRYWYLPLGLVIAFQLTYSLYRLKYQLDDFAEDMLDYFIFDIVKDNRGSDSTEMARKRLRELSERRLKEDFDFLDEVAKAG